MIASAVQTRILRPDITVFDKHGKPQMVVEVKNRSALSLEWATRYHRNLVVHGALPSTPYFLLALSDFFYLWKNKDVVMLDIPPHYVIDATEALAGFIGPHSQPLDEASGFGLQMLVASWLEVLMISKFNGDSVPLNIKWFIDSGLYDAIKEGSTLLEAELTS